MKRRHVYLGIAALAGGILLLAAGYWLGRASRPEEDMARSTRRTIYVVQEFSWRWRGNQTPVFQDDERPGKPVTAFSERARAEAHCQQLNLQKRATENPFRYMPQGWGYTTMGKAAFLAFIRAEGLTPPADFPNGEDDLAWAWAEWWDEHVSEWDGRRVERLWGALDGLSFYEVREIALEP
jgi:hypothetical protein